MSKETVQINLKTLTQQVQDGMKKVELADYYKLPMLLFSFRFVLVVLMFSN